MTVTAAHALECNVVAPVGVSPWSTSDYVTGQHYGVLGGCAGAAGMAFDRDGNLLLVNGADGGLYTIGRVGIGGGGATRINAIGYPPEWCPQALVFSADFQHLYMARQFCGQGGGDVVEISPLDGRVIRTVARGTLCATGLAVDPLSGDLFVSSPCETGVGTEFIYRITNPSGTFPFVNIFAVPGHAHGLAFSSDGTLWTTVLHYDTKVRDIVRISGTGAMPSGVATVMASAPPGDPLNAAIGVVPMARDADPAHPAMLYVLLDGGGMRSVDLRRTPRTAAVMATGGNPQTALIAGPDGCLYASSMDRVYRAAAADGSCNLGIVAKPVDSVAQEYYNATLNHYFVTASDTEKASVETGGAGPDWAATGYFFNIGGNGAVCRFYGNREVNAATGQPYGPNSHFYTIEPDECSAVRRDPGWVFESPRVFNMVPVSSPGNCAFGLRPIFRAYNVRSAQNDSNHRYTASAGIYQQMIAQGWRGEGIVFCAQG